jgi:hypothetical protein
MPIYFHRQYLTIHNAELYIRPSLERELNYFNDLRVVLIENQKIPPSVFSLFFNKKATFNQF